MKFKFDPSSTTTTTFIRRKSQPSDAPFLLGLEFNNWAGGPLSHERICSGGEWVISDGGEYLLFGTGGGSFEIPEMYEFKYRDKVIHLSCGGGALCPNIFTRDESGAYSVHIFIDGFIVPKELLSERENIATKIADAFATKYENCKLEVIFGRD